MKNKTFLILSFFAINSFAQTKNSNDNFNVQNGTLNLNSTTIDTTTDEKEFIGDFKVAKVSGYSEQESYRYNAMNDNFEFLEGNKRRALQKNNGQKVTFVDGTEYEVVNYIDSNGDLRNGYLESLTKLNKKFKLYKSYKVSIVESINKNSYDGSASGKNYRTEANYYLSDSDKIVYLPKSAKKIENILKSNVQELVKSNKLNLNKEQDLIKLVDLLNK